MKIFYHEDLDGECSASLLSKFSDKRALLIPIHHDRKNEYDIKIQADEVVYFLDCAPPVEKMKEILGVSKRIIWIDHHKTNVSAYKDAGLEIPGLRIDGIAACELTWLYLWGCSNLNNRKRIPFYIRLIGDRDVWKWEYKETAEFTAGMMVEHTHPTSDIWRFLRERDHAEIATVMNKGNVVLQYLSRNREYIVDNFAYETRIAGHNALVCNSHEFTSELFGELFDEYDIVGVYCFNGERYRVSLYSQTIDVGEIAKNYGGGGHRNAAGYTTETLPFESVEEGHHVPMPMC